MKKNLEISILRAPAELDETNQMDSKLLHGAEKISLRHSLESAKRHGAKHAELGFIITLFR